MQRLRLAGIDVEGHSVGGVETCIMLPGLKVALDIGRCPPEAIARDTVLFTHAHMDHMGGVAYHTATRALRHMRPPTYVVPRVNAADFERLFEAWRALDRSVLPHETVALAPGDEHVLPNGLVVRPFPSPHRVFCQGYALVTRKRKLRPELATLTPAELRDLRVEQGVEIAPVEETVEVAFTGDTRIEVVEQEEVVRRARLLILETTFLDDRVSVAECRDKGHVHLDEVIERAELFQNEALLLTHFSARYRADEVAAILARRLPPLLRERVTPLVAGLA
jgi:ribonuclease Z